MKQSKVDEVMQRKRLLSFGGKVRICVLLEDSLRKVLSSLST